MASPITRAEEQILAPRSPVQKNIRTDGRAFNSPNWRSPQASPIPRVNSNANANTNTSRTAFSRPGPHAPQAISEGRRLYVGNMPYTATSEDVQSVFDAAEFQIERIDIAIDPFTGRNPSYCFVDFHTKQDAERAMAKLDGRDMQGRPLKIKPGVTKSTTDRNPEPSKVINSMGRWRSQAETATTVVETNSDSTKRVYVGGLPRLADPDEVQSKIREFFAEFNVENVSKLFAPHPAKRFEPGQHYYLFVDFGTEKESHDAALRMGDRQGPWGDPLKVRSAYRSNNNSRG